MGLFSDIKKLFFAQKSVAKNAIDKAKEQGSEMIDKASSEGKEWFDKAKEEGGEWIDKAKEEGGEWLETAKEKGSDWAEKAKVKGEELSEKAMEKGAEWKDKAEGKLDDLMDSFDTPEDKSPTDDSSVTPTVQGTGPESNPHVPTSSVPREASFVERLGKKTIEATESLGNKALDGLESAAEKTMELSESIGEKVMDAKDSLVEKSKEAVEYLDEKLDETVEKAKNLDKKIAAESNDKDQDGFADTPIDIDKSELEGKDDFFSKAEAYAKGEPMDPNKVTIESTETTPQISEKKAYGFEDLDGDGNELIDDAIVEEE